MKSKESGDLSSGIAFGRWTTTKRIGRGGNGQVWLAQDSMGTTVAIKVLTKVKEVAHHRFRDEVKIMQSCGVTGVVPVLDAYLPDWPTEEHAWYAMPVGVPLAQHLDKDEITTVVSQVVDVASALVELHVKGITHRDIKPANIIAIDGKACLGDFGLVDYPEKDDLTGFREELGPRWTMAPEVRRHEDGTDSRPADVFSLAKSLWILITGISEGFDGRYDGSKGISIRSYSRDEFIEPLENLLTEATEHNPLARPGMREFRDRLVSWLGLHSDFSKRNPIEWEYAQKKLFPISTPSHAEWKDIEAIVSVLNTIGPKTNLNHLFFPTGGGLDLENARLSQREEGCIELITDGLINILKPKSLQFEGFGSGEEWDYFRLECDVLKSSEIYKNSDAYGYEELLDLGGGQYVDRVHWDINEYKDESLPEEAELISRYFRGVFVIFQKTSTYNKIPETYDGRHSKMSAEVFRQYIEAMIDAVAKLHKERPD